MYAATTAGAGGAVAAAAGVAATVAGAPVGFNNAAGQRTREEGDTRKK